GWTPGPLLIHGHQPLIIPLPEFGKRAFPGLRKHSEIVIQIIALDGLTRRITKRHGDAPLLLHAAIPFSPFHPLEDVLMIQCIGGSEMIKHRPYSVSLVVEQK